MKLIGAAVAFTEANVDTDIIMPARFLKRIFLDGFEQFAFFEKRFGEGTVCEPDVDKRDFVYLKKVLREGCMLNHPNAVDASVLVTGENFGCGSSREHAVYGLRNYRVILGGSRKGKSAFADIFRNNCTQNLIWTPVVDEDAHQAVVKYITSNIDSGPVMFSFDFENDIVASGDGKLSESFTISEPIRAHIRSARDRLEVARERLIQDRQTIIKWQNVNAEFVASFPRLR